MNDADYERFWRNQGATEAAVPVPAHLVDADWSIGHE